MRTLPLLGSASPVGNSRRKRERDFRPDHAREHAVHSTKRLKQQRSTVPLIPAHVPRERVSVLSLRPRNRERCTFFARNAPACPSRPLARWAPAADGAVTTAEETEAEELLNDHERIERGEEELDRCGREVLRTMNSPKRRAPDVQSTRGRTSSSSSGSTGTKPERR